MVIGKGVGVEYQRGRYGRDIVEIDIIRREDYLRIDEFMKEI